MNAEEIKLLQAQNEALKKQCNSLQQEVKQWKHEYEMLDACIELEQGKIAELKEEVKQLHSGRTPEELYTLFGKPIKYWEELKAEDDRLKEEITEVKKYQYQQEYLDKEIEEMQKALKTLAEGLNKRQMILQKIKKYIAKICKEECGYVQKKRCPDCDCRYGAILDLITKAEEEWK